MPAAPLILDRPQRWDASFDPEMSQAAVDRLLLLAPFKEMKSEKFPKRVSLRDILLHDTRLRRFRAGEIVVRAGDYGTSAFLILSGTVRVVLGPDLPASVLGRRATRRRGFFRAFAQLWTNSKEPERRRPWQLKQDVRVAARQGEGDEVKIFLQDVPRILDEHKTATLQAGDFFGEMAALSRMPRNATVFAEGDAELIEIRWQGLRDLMKYDDKLRAHIDKIYRDRALEAYLRELPMFRRVGDDALKKVMAQTEFATYGEYDWSGEYKRLVKSGAAGLPDQEQTVAQEGDYPNGVVLVRAGFARLSQKFGHGHRTLNYLGCGQSYGLREIAHNWRNKTSPVPLQYTLRVIGYTHLIVIPTAVMEEFVLPAMPERDLPPPIEAKESKDGREPPPEDIDAGAKIGPDLVEFMTENRFFNGTATMVIDLDRCTRCDDCVRACAATHDNNPRFLRHGPVSGKIMIANACMHCVDPVCMIGCPTGAIHRHAFGG
ncbi:MAG TPA: cyclic nucleotide-binding domain-containing protein, partial [Candidatus Eisenbacteria bacterium]|nr:cyclic nucleotide-binding domain-containing protein [Candidatus Eisenbacteria bacterium]